MALVAWFLRDILNLLIPFPTENMVDGLLNLEDTNDRKILYGLRFIVWIFLLYLLFKYIQPLLFSFLLPTAHRYAATKPLRRIQGVTAEFALLGYVFIFILIPLAMWPLYKDVNERIEQNVEAIEKARQDSLSTFEATRDSIITELQNNAETVNKYLVYQRNQAEAEENFFDPTYYIPTEAKFPVVYPDVLTKRTIPPYKSSYSFTEKYLNLENDDVYAEYVGKHNLLIDTYFTTDSIYQNLSQPVEPSTYQVEGRSKTWSDFKYNPLAFVGDAFLRTTPLALMIAFIIYVISHFPIRYDIAGWYVNILRFFEQGRFGFGGSARFAGLVEEWASLYKKQKYGLFMGRSLYNPFLNIGLEDKRHMLTIAGSRAGKGATAIIPNLLLWEGSALVIDPKGTNAAVTARRRQEMGHNVYLVDPFNLVTGEGEKSDSFNPLAHLNPDSPTIREEITAIAEALVVRDHNQKETHWDDGAKTVIAGMIAHLISWPDYSNPVLPMLRDMISDMPDKQVELWADMSLNPGAGRLAKDAANRIIRGGQSNEILSILSNADKHTEWLSSPAIQSAITESTFSFAELKEKPTTIYLILPPHHLETHKRFLRLFVNLAISQMSVGGRSKVPVLLMMDEFLALGRMEEVEKAYGLMAGYNLIMWPFVQDFGRLKDLYGNSVNAFITNSRAVQVFGVFDEETTQFVSKQLGYRTLRSFSGSNKEQNAVMLRATDEVAKDVDADSGRQYVLRAGKAPMLLEKVPYYDSTVWKFMADLNIPSEKNNRFKGIFEGKYSPDPDYAGA